METVIESPESARRVFISYSTSDRRRVDGLERLLVLFGHKPFLDFKQIRLGSRWQDEIKSALDQTDVTLVYWTRSASSSIWVRNEYEYFLARHPSRPLVPIVGDETPLPEPLKERQAMTFVPVINELLELKRSMEAEGKKQAEIRAAIQKRLEESSIRLEQSDLNRVFRFFGVAGWMAWLPAPLVLFKWLWRSLFEATAHLTPAQAALMLTVAATTAALTHQAGRGGELADPAGNARNVAGPLNQEESAKEKELTNQLKDARLQAKVKQEELANQLEDARKSDAQLKAQDKAREDELEKQLERLRSKFRTHALVQVDEMAKPVLLRFIDSTTGQHRFTVQIPKQQDFSCWIPKGSYQIYYAHTDISGNSRQLVGGEVERGRLAQTLDPGMLLELSLREGAAASIPVSADDWGRAAPENKR
jgi:TIR domain